VSRRADDGTTLAEFVVGTSLLGVVLAGAAAFAVGTQTTISRTQVTARTQTELRAVADVLSRQLPAASAVSDPGTSGGSWFLEYRVDATASGAAVCYQWKLDGDSGTLAERSWDPVTAVPTPWVTHARDVSNDPATDPPFAVTPAADAGSLARVDAAVAIRHTGGPLLRSIETFTLRNLPYGSTSSTSCSQVARS
jgi:hypothetical protein